MVKRATSSVRSGRMKVDDIWFIETYLELTEIVAFLSFVDPAKWIGTVRGTLLCKYNRQGKHAYYLGGILFGSRVSKFSENCPFYWFNICWSLFRRFCQFILNTWQQFTCCLGQPTKMSQEAPWWLSWTLRKICPWYDISENKTIQL